MGGLSLREITHTTCRNPTLAKCGGEAQHLEKIGIGVVATLAFGLRLRQGG
jgi:hypothetical protein